MIDHMKRHERRVLEMIGQGLEPAAREELLEEHLRQIGWMQHERLVHLLVMLFVCLFALLVLGFALFRPSLALLALFALLTVLASAYIVHYYRIENAVQRWYDLYERIRSQRP